MQNSDYELADRVSRITLDEIGETGITVEMIFNYMHQMSAAILKHQEEGGKAGTHAYDLLAAAETEHAKTTETLIHMVAATVLHKLIADEGGGRANVSFSPADMEDMHKLYEMHVNRDGMTTDIKIEPRAASRPSLKLSHDRDGNDEIETAKPQAVARPEEPNWFALIGGERLHCADQKSAEHAVRQSIMNDPLTPACVENRRCPHVRCPAPTHIDNCMATFCPNKSAK